MKEELHQGDILRIEHIKKPVLVVSEASRDIDYRGY